MQVHTKDDEEGDEIRNNDVSIEPVPMDITNGEHTEDVALVPVDILEVVGDIDGYENSTG
jgi:hypothetical protein